MTSSDASTCSERLQRAREYLGFSEAEVASALGIPACHVSQIEAGVRDAGVVELRKFSLLYRVTVEYLQSGREAESAGPVQFSFLARAIKGLPQEDVDEVSRFAEFLKNCSN